MTSLRERDPFDVRLARLAPDPLQAFNDAGVISSADIHVARCLARLAKVDDPDVLLAMAFAARGPRLGHVLVDLATIRQTVAIDTEEPVALDALPWPDPVAWTTGLAECGLVQADAQPPDGTRPLRLVGTRLYLDRYWREEQQVAADILDRAAARVDGVELEALTEGLDRLCGTQPADERRWLVAQAAILGRLTVVAGGPGTGKTSIVARIAALLAEQAEATGTPKPLIALAAPTGKAATRLVEAVHEQAPDVDTTDEVREQLLALKGSTIHRLLGWRPGSHSRFRHDRTARLPHDMVIVDEASMVSLTQMARLMEAVRPDARLVLVGDPDQLTSIEAGAVLGDIVGPAAKSQITTSTTRSDAPATDGESALAAPSNSPIGQRIVVLTRVYRHGAEIGRVAAAIRSGDPDATIDALSRATDPHVTWIPIDAADPNAAAALAPVKDQAVQAGRDAIAAASQGHAHKALTTLGGFRLLCAHRRGPHGISAWIPKIETWLAPDIDAAGGHGRDYPGRPLLITANDYDLELFNGDTGVVVATANGTLTAAFERRGDVMNVRSTRLGAVETVYAMTVHKSQGSQFDTVAIIMPPTTSRILTRELLYTAVTRARTHLILVGTEDTIRAAVERPVARATGLRPRLWEAGEAADDRAVR